MAEGDAAGNRIPAHTSVGYVDAAHIFVNAFTLHVALGMSESSGEIAGRVEIAMSRDFARHLAEALELALARTEDRTNAEGDVSAATSGIIAGAKSG